MTDREELAGLVDDVLSYIPWGEVTPSTGKEIADHLIANGVTVRNRGHWIIHPSGRSKDAPKYAECSVCHTTGSPHWKSCPVCDAMMED